ncbi:MAG: hypothetical protein GX376_00595 [Firmicutes bacterium]|nr:hypothetical protein [Bacillota bacterium]
MGKVTILWLLQDIDNQRENLQWEADNSKIRHETQVLGLELEKKQRALQALTKELAKIKRRIRRGERGSAGNIEQIEELETRLYSGQITNLQELDQIQKRVIQLAQEGEKLEEQVISSMLEQDELEKKRDALAVVVKDLGEKLGEKQVLLKKETTEVEDKLAALLAEREKLLGMIDRKWLKLYSEIGQRKQGQAVAAVADDLCLGCHISLPTNLVSRIITNERLQTCPSCGRILYYQGK